MDPRPCWVLDGDDRWPGTVLEWRRGDAGWRPLVRYLRPMPEGYRLAYEHWLPGSEPAERPTGWGRPRPSSSGGENAQRTASR